MMKDEFEKLIGKEISPDNYYNFIETVYMSFPNLSKETVAQLYNECGIVPFVQLQGYIRLMEDLQKKESAAEHTLNEVRQEIKKLKMEE